MPVHPCLVTAIGGALLLAGCTGGDTYVLATITRGDVPASTPIRAIETTIELGEMVDMTPMLSPAGGAEMTLPATLSLEIGAGDGLAVVGANAYGDGDTLIASGSTEMLIAHGDVTPVTIELGHDIVSGDQSLVSVDEPSIVFGGHTVGTSHQETIRVSNSGTGPSMPLDVARVGVGATQFSIVDDACSGMALAASATCTFDVSFNPAMVGSAGATVEVRPYPLVAVVGLSGSGVLFSLTPSSLGFGNVAVASSVTEMVMVTNESATMSTQAITLEIDGAAEFAIDAASTCTSGQILAPSASCTVVVRFTPVDTGLENASLNVTDRATMSLALSGTGT